MMPLDDAPGTEDDVRSTILIDETVADDAAPTLTEIWSSIGPGRVPDRGEGPPTIRPADLVRAMPPHRATTDPQDRILPATSEKDLPVTDTPPAAPHSTGPDATSDALREELRIGVRMLQALETQFTRAESLIRREEDAARRADEATDRLTRRLESIDTGAAVAATIDAEAIDRAASEAIERITTTADDVARRLHDRLERFVALDTRLDELDATLHTVERRLTRIDESIASPSATPPDTTEVVRPTASSGTLSVEPRPAATSSTGTTTSPAPSEATFAAIARLQLLIDRGEEVRRELRRDLEAICTASGTLVEIVEQAATTERTLRETIETVGAAATEAAPSTTGPNWSVASILRRLADEFDAGLRTDTPDTARSAIPTARPMPAGLTPTRPIELDVQPGDGTPVRREPLIDTSIEASEPAAT